MVSSCVGISIDIGHDGFVGVMLTSQYINVIGGFNCHAPFHIVSFYATISIVVSFVATYITIAFIDVKKIKTIVCFAITSTNQR
jgi:hypothetical protein